MGIDQVKKRLKGRQITIDLDNQRCQRKIDEKWLPLRDVRYVAITRVRMNQRISNGLYLSSQATYQAFCVYIKTEKLNIMAYRGRRDVVLEEAEIIAAFLKVPVKDLLPRNKDGQVEDDDHPGGCKLNSV